MPVREIDVNELYSLGSEQVHLVDVRETDEFNESHVPGARHIALATIPDHVGEFPKDQTLYLICAVGGRSMRATEFLADAGFDAVNVSGGTKGWIAADLPVQSGLRGS